MHKELTELAGYTLAKGFYYSKNRPEHTALTFPRYGLIAPYRVRGSSVNQLAGVILDAFGASIKDKQIETHFPILFLCAAETAGLSKRVTAVKKQFMALLTARFGRIAKLVTATEPVKPQILNGFFVYFTDFEEAICSSELYFGGQHREADDELAPSRSFLKVQEAYAILGIEPQVGETVADLGAAPGGWSFSAAKRGAVVTAIDNGPLKNGAANNKNIIHLPDDAFKFQPEAGTRFDWLFCDMVEQPHHVMRQIEKWLANRWCWHYVINLKFGRVNPVELIKEVNAPTSCFSKHSFSFQVKHLFHDRNEITICGTVKN